MVLILKEISPILIIMVAIKYLEGRERKGRIGEEKAAGLVTRRSASGVMA